MIETLSGIKINELIKDNMSNVIEAKFDMGCPTFKAENIPVTIQIDKIVSYLIIIHDFTYTITCLSKGNPHCVIFCDDADIFNLSKIGPFYWKSNYISAKSKYRICEFNQ